MNQGPHPLDPLSAAEITTVAEVLRRDRGITPPGWRFASIELVEPDKGAPAPPVRQAAAVCWNRADGEAFRAVVSIRDAAVTGWEHLPGQQPNMTVDEWHECDEMLRAHPQLIDALARRGITDMSLVLTDVWAYGAALVPERYRGLRIGWADVWHRGSEDGNPYAHSVSGMHPIVDLNRMELLELEDDPGAGDAPEVMGEYLPKLIGMPLGEGLRPGAHRLSFAEMIVPYRDATPDHYRRTAFDIGEWGLGFMTTSLELGCDCLGEISYLDAVIHDSRGQPHTIRNAICIHEEDSGILWKHVDERSGAQSRRARRLVVSFHVTVANYEYLVYWRFYQDGSIECEVQATGIMVTSYFPDPANPPYGTLVDERTYAPFHQHFIVARLDLDVDGPRNTVYASQSEALPIGADNPHGLGLVIRDTPLRTEAEGKQDYDWGAQRGWKVVNDNVRNV